ncbi:MAG TPA: hypothetical protein PLM65_01835 [Smithella sp.]|nr:hypothetical protein [Smithella sp.]
MNPYITQLRNTCILLTKFLKERIDIVAIILIAVLISLPSISPLLSGNKVNLNADFLYYASMHESVRKAVFEYHTFPLRSFWVGGGYPTLGNPEDPTLNPLTLITLVFGSIMGLKIIVLMSLLIGGISTYLLTRYILGYTRWGALFCGLVIGLSLFIPLRVYDGNTNEVYGAFIPLCLLLIGLVCRGRKAALLALPFIFYIMLSDGKLNALMAFLYIGILCFLEVIPFLNIFGTKDSNKINVRPLKIFVCALTVTFLIGMLRILPALELIETQGGLRTPFLWYMSNSYVPQHVVTPVQLWQKLIGSESIHLLTIGVIPVLIALVSFIMFPVKALPWGIVLFLFAWLTLAHNAPLDLLKMLSNLPVFNVITNPLKYFAFQIVFSLVIVAGQFFWLLAKMRRKWQEPLSAIALIFLSVWFLYPKVYEIQENTYTYDIPVELLIKQNEFYNIQSTDTRPVARLRTEPLHSIAYTNTVRGIGTIDWMAAMKLDEKAVPQYFVDEDGTFIPNPEYQGEAYFTDMQNKAAPVFRPNSIIVQVNLKTPDMLIINQNYHRDWYTDRGRIFDKDGLIALHLDETGTYKVTLRYISRSFFIGLMVSILSLITLIFVCWSYKSGRLMRWSIEAPVCVRWMPKFILWLIH